MKNFGYKLGDKQTILVPKDLKNSDTYYWRKALKYHLCNKFNYTSDLSGTPFKVCHLHEGILTRANVPKSLSWQWMIFHEYNCFLLTPEEHIPNPPSREWAVQKSFDKYGIDNVIQWFYSLPFKYHPFRIESYAC